MIIDNIDWELTGENKEPIDDYSWYEKVSGYDDDGNRYEGKGIISSNELSEVKEIEKIN